MDLSQTRGNNSDEGEALIDGMRGDRREKRESFIAGMRGDRGSLAERGGQFSVLPSVTSSVVTKEVGLSWSPERLKQKEVSLAALSRREITLVYYSKIVSLELVPVILVCCC